MHGPEVAVQMHRADPPSLIDAPPTQAAPGASADKVLKEAKQSRSESGGLFGSDGHQGGFKAETVTLPVH